MAEKIDPDAVEWSAGASDREGRPLLVMMHGFGSDESDLFSLATALPLEPVIASIRAPLPAPWPLDGWAWFTSDPECAPEADEVNASADAVIDWLDALEVAPSSIGLLGFSQGAAMTMQLMRRQPERFAYGVAMSGFVTPGSEPGDEVLAERRPPVFWGRGSDDPVVPESAVLRTTDWLPGHSTLSGRIYERLGHGISEQGAADVREFIRRQL